MPRLPIKLNEAVTQLRRGGVIAYPTEGVWGIGCDPFDERAVNRLLAIKRRPVDKGLILVAGNIAQLTPFLRGLEADQLARLEGSWPGPFTWLVPDNGTAPAWIRGDHDAVALRVSNHPQVVELCRAFGGPIVSTSANRAGHPVAQFGWQLTRQLPQIDYILRGPLGGSGKPSTIRDLRSGEILRGL